MIDLLERRSRIVHESGMLTGDGVRSRAAGWMRPELCQAVVSFGGSILAEHGVGLEKRPYLPISRSSVELSLMRTIKNSLDPNGILNPGKVLERPAELVGDESKR